MPARMSSLAALLLVAGGGSLLAAPPAQLPAEQLDWQVYDTRPSGMVCRGFYLSPELDLPEADLSPAAASLLIDAGRVLHSPVDGLVMDGGVRLRQGPVFAQADEIRLSADRTEAQMHGNLEIRQSDLLLRAREGQYALSEQSFRLDEVHYVIHQQRRRGSAWQLQQLSDGRVVLREASMTTCAPDDSAWQLVVGRLTLDQEKGVGDARHVRLHIKDVPVFYMPWFRFPLDDRRQTGLLYPRISWEKESGLDYLQPVYLNLAPSHDMTLYPRLIEQRGIQGGLELRYLRPTDEGEIYYSYLDRDKVYYKQSRWHIDLQHRGALSPQLSYSLDFAQVSDDSFFTDLGSYPTNDSRELLQELQLRYRQQQWTAELALRGYQNLTPSRDRNIAADEAVSQYQLFDLRHQQDADLQGYYQLPQFELRGTDEWSERLSWAVTFELTHFSKLFDREVSGDSYFSTDLKETPGKPGDFYVTQWGAPDTWRLFLEPGITAEQRWPWSFVRAQARLRHSQYWLDPYWSPDDQADAALNLDSVNLQPSVTAPILSLDSGVFLERDVHLGEQPFIYSLEPRVFGAFIPYVEQYDVPNIFDGAFKDFDFNQFYRAERTVGRDRVADISKITLGLTQRLLSPVTGREVMSFGVAQEYYLSDRRMADYYSDPRDAYLHPDDPDRPDNQPREERPYSLVRNRSSLGFVFNWNFHERLGYRATLLWDDYFRITERSDQRISYTHPSDVHLNLGHTYVSNFSNQDGLLGPKPDRSLADAYSYRASAEDQVYVSGVFPLDDHWRLFLKRSYDLKRREVLDDIAGLEYNSCCWQVQLLYRDSVRYMDESPELVNGRFASRERDPGVYLRLIFKGLGGAGHSTQSLLANEIQGYTDRE
ncbi:LPS-assembly protein LptD [Marinospirillum alkaliphilum]|nr:LPS assembly protein LptD [Marinospirillum alkaliphilum]